MNTVPSETPTPDGESNCSASGSQTIQLPPVTSWRKRWLLLSIGCLVGLLAVYDLVTLSSRPTYHPVSLLDVSPLSEVSEEKFLLFLLEDELDQIDFLSRRKPEEALPRLAENKAIAVAVTKHLHTASPHKEDFAPLFEQLAYLPDAYQTMLSDIGRVETLMSEKQGDLVWKSGLTGIGTGWMAAQMDDNGDTARAFVAVISSIVTAWQQGQAIADEKKSRLESAASLFTAQLNKTRSDATVLADRLAQKNSWPRASLGFLPDRKSFGQELMVRPMGELPPILAGLKDQSPDNPFLKVQSIQLEDTLDKDETGADKLNKWSDEYLEITRMFPAGPAYDKMRRDYVLLAGFAALRAADLGGKGKALGAETKSSLMAASCCKTALNMDTTDPSGAIRWCYGRSLALVGNLEAAAAILVEVKDLMAGEPEYHYLMSRIRSVEGETDAAMEHFKMALSKGFSGIAEARTIPDLDDLRSDYDEEMQALLTVKYSWSVTYGLLNDDITIVNESTFPLTHLELQPVITNARGSFSPTKPLTLDNLKPGESHKWVNRISVSGGKKGDGQKAELICDQNKQ